MSPDDKTKATSSSRKWLDLEPKVADWIVEAMAAYGFQHTTPVQWSAIPLFRTHDVLVEAVTGSGKTLAFLIPIVEKLLRLDEMTKKYHIAAIIVSPTRELASQTYSVLQSLLGFHDRSAAELRRIARIECDDSDEDEETADPVFPPDTLKVVPQLLVGGTTTTAQDLKSFLRNSPNLLIATPGRLLELLNSPHVKCPQSSFEILVLDEADRLLDLGFKEDLQKILTRLPKQRRTGLFSASVSEAVDQLVRLGLRNPVKIAVRVKGLSGGTEQRTPASLKMRYIVAPASHRFPALIKLLKSLPTTPAKTIVYLSTCAAVDYFQHLLPPLLNSTGENFLLVPLHGKQNPKAREAHFSRFTNSLLPSILLTTDVAARGLDVKGMDLVVQIDPPVDPKVFLHRCGRAGRAGRKGLSVIFLLPGREEDFVPFMKVRQTPITLLESPVITVSDEEAAATTETMRRIVLEDRGLHDLSHRSFPGWVKSYTKHQASSIFRISDIDWTDTANAWGLLKLPKMPELKNWEGDKTLSLDIDFASYTYKDKQREKLRLQKEKEWTESKETRDSNEHQEHKGKKRAWSQKLDEKDEKEKRRSMKKAKKAREKWENMTPEERQKEEERQILIEKVKKAEKLENEEFNGFDD